MTEYNLDNTTTGTATINEWHEPTLIKTTELKDSIEMIYKQQSKMWNNWGAVEPRVYKIIFSCVDGKWNKSEPIYGTIVSPKEESYDFND